MTWKSKQSNSDKQYNKINLKIKEWIIISLEKHLQQSSRGDASKLLKLMFFRFYGKLYY